MALAAGTLVPMSTGLAGSMSMVNRSNTRKDKGNTTLLLRVFLTEVKFASGSSGCQVIPSKMALGQLQVAL